MTPSNRVLAILIQIEKIILNHKKKYIYQLNLSTRQFLTSAKKINSMFSIFLFASEWWSKLLKELNFNNKYRITARMYQQ